MRSSPSYWSRNSIGCRPKYFQDTEVIGTIFVATVDSATWNKEFGPGRGFEQIEREELSEDTLAFLFASSEKSVGHRYAPMGAPEAPLAQPANPMWDSAASAFSCS
jgi:hypothetical protein